MVSSLAWLDTSPEEQHRIREMIALFTKPGTLDELGIGQIRDAFSDALFPGTSTLHTRARYFLLTPWAFMHETEKASDSEDLVRRARGIELKLVETLNRMEGQHGVFGSRAGRQVKTLPSEAYWGGLQRLNILLRNVGRNQLSVGKRSENEADERYSRAERDWSSTIPPIPDGFPNELDDGLDLPKAEAEWLSERIFKSIPDTLLAHLVRANTPIANTTRYPWQDEACLSAPAPASELLHHARLFSLAMLGATRLYHALLATKSEALGAGIEPGYASRFRDAFDNWVRDAQADQHRLEEWSLDDFWRTTMGLNSRVTPRTKGFVTDWVRSVQDGTAATALENDHIHSLIENREVVTKGRLARLRNDEMLARWQGRPGGPGLDYRWNNIKTFVTDIHQGLKRA